MKKEIKDYLHLYLGANYIIKYKYKTHYTRKALPRLTNGSYYNVVSLLRFPQYYDVKLLLRPLSDMTEEEKKEYLSIIGESQMYRDGFFYLGEYGFLNIRNNNITASFGFNPESIKYLLSKHFDLFGLIEAGLAIDKTTLKQQS